MHQQIDWFFISMYNKWSIRKCWSNQNYNFTICPRLMQINLKNRDFVQSREKPIPCCLQLLMITSHLSNISFGLFMGNWTNTNHKSAHLRRVQVTVASFGLSDWLTEPRRLFNSVSICSSICSECNRLKRSLTLHSSARETRFWNALHSDFIDEK